MSRRSAALSESWPCSLPLPDCSSPRLGLCSWSETGEMIPPGHWADGTVSEADVDNQGSQSVFLASCNAQQHSARPRLGPVWCSPDNHPLPRSSCTACDVAELGLQPWHRPPRGDVVLGCVGNMSLT